MDNLLAAKKILATALELDVPDIPDDAAIGNLYNWDSLAHLRLIKALEEHTGTQLPPETVVSIGNLKDVATIILDY